MRRSGARFSIVTTLVLVLTTASSALAQSDDERAAARAAATKGAEALEQGRVEEALDLFSRAEAIIHAPPHLLYIARAHTKLGHLVKAHEAYVKITRETLGPNTPEAFREAQAIANTEAAELEPRIPTLKVDVEGAPAESVLLEIDGQKVPSAMIGLARPIDPGKHQIQAKTADSASDVVSVTLAERAHQSVKLKLVAATWGGDDHVTASSEPAARKGSRVPAFAALGVGAVGIVVGTVFVLQNHSKRGEADDLCPTGPCPESRRADVLRLDDEANTAATMAWVGYGVGAVGLGVGAFLLLTTPGASATPPPATGIRVRPSVGFRSIGLGGVF